MTLPISIPGTTKPSGRRYIRFIFLSSCLFALIFLPAIAAAQQQISNEPREVTEVFEAMYRYNLPEAELKLKGLKEKNISQDWIDLAQANLLWWWLISGDESHDYDHEMSLALNRVINRYRTRPIGKLSHEEVFTMIHSYAYLTRVDIYKERYFKGIINLGHTMDYLKLALASPDQYDKFLMVSGLYNYFAAATQVEYPVFIPFFALAPKSNRDLGFQQLSHCSRMNNILIKNESLYYLMKIDYQLEKNYTGALNIADELISRYPNNLIYHFHRFMILIESKQRPQALAQYSKLIEISVKAPSLNQLQRNHLIDVAKKRLLKEKINPAI